MWCLHVIVWHDNRFNATLTFFDRADGFTLFIQQIRSDLDWNDSMHFFGIFFQRFFFNQTQNGKCQGFVITDCTGTATARADVMAGFAQRWAETLTRHFQQAKT